MFYLVIGERSRGIGSPGLYGNPNAANRTDPHGNKL